ncbi:MAG: AAA family ATPase [Bacteroidota bacterium]
MNADTQLKEVLNRVVAEQNGNIVAHLFARFWGTAIDYKQKPEQIFEQLQRLLRQYSDTSKLPELSPAEQKPERELTETDFRIKGIRLSSLRGIPKSKDGNLYGFDLTTKQGEVQSAVILGTNGSGKSSIFSALEYIYCKEVSEKLLRSEKRDFDSERAYLNRFGALSTETEAKLLTNQTSYSLVEPIWKKWETFERTARPSTHFISDYDIYEVGKMSDESLEERIAEYLGLGEVIKAYNVLKNLSKYSRRKEINRLSQLKSQFDSISKDIEQTQAELQLVQEELRKIDSNDDQNELTERQKKVQTLNQMLNVFDAINITPKILLDSAKSYSSTYSQLREYLSFSGNKEEIQFWQIGLKLLRESTDCPFCGKSHLSIVEIEKHINEQFQKHQKFSERETATIKAFTELQSALVSTGNFIDSLANGLKQDQLKMQSVNPNSTLLETNRKLIKSIEDFNKFEEVSSTINEFQKIKDPYRGDFEKIENVATTLIIPLWHSVIDKINQDFIAFRNNRKTELQELINNTQLGTSIAVLTSKSTLKTKEVNTQSKLSSQKNDKEKIESEIKSINQQIKDNQRIVDGIERLFSGITKERNSIIKDSIQGIIGSIKNLIEEFWDDNSEREFDIVLEYRDVQVDRETTIEKLFFRLREQTSKQEIKPSDYLNTSRYRLLASAIAIALALEVRKREKINLPFIIDDEFFAADIASRNKAYSFFLKLLNRLKETNLEPQVIVFTHDDLIYNSAAMAFAKYYDNTQKEKYALVRLFQPDNENDILVQSSNGDKYWDLLFDLGMPTNIKTNVNTEARL